MEAVAHAISPDVAISTIGKLETGRMALSLDWLRDIAKVLGVSVSEIIEEDRNYRMLPVLDSTSASTSSKAIKHATEWIPVPGSTWSGREFVLRVADDSFSEIAEANDLAIVDPEQAALMGGKLYVVSNASQEKIFKRFQVDPPQLVSCSRSEAQKSILVGSEPFTVIGRVTKVIRNLD